MTSTLVKDSLVGDAWIQATQAAVPIQFAKNDKGEVTTDVLTGPVRLSFEFLFDLPKVTPKNQNPKHGSILIFPNNADLQILYNEFYRVAALNFADNYDPTTQQYIGIRSPFRNQLEKGKFAGFQAGGVFMTCTSKFKPPVVDAMRNPIVDRNKVYAGVWAICAINAYPYKEPTNKGIAFGLQSVMIIGDDQKLGGGAPDPNKTFAGVNVAAPIVAPHLAGSIGGMAPAPSGAPAGTVPMSMPTSGVPAVGSAPAPRPAPPAAPAGNWTPPAPVAPVDEDNDYSFLG